MAIARWSRVFRPAPLVYRPADGTTVLRLLVDLRNALLALSSTGRAALRYRSSRASDLIDNALVGNWRRLSGLHT